MNWRTHRHLQLLRTQDTVFHYSGMDGTVQALDLKSGELTASLTLPSQVSPSVFLPDFGLGFTFYGETFD
jgi:hypothetical protein